MNLVFLFLFPFMMCSVWSNQTQKIQSKSTISVGEKKKELWGEKIDSYRSRKLLTMFVNGCWQNSGSSKNEFPKKGKNWISINDWMTHTYRCRNKQASIRSPKKEKDSVIIVLNKLIWMNKVRVCAIDI